MKNLTSALLFCLALGSPLLFTSCNDDSFPEAENEEELVTAVTLTFTPTTGGTAIIANASDPDGAGEESLIVAEEIVLQANTSYQLSIDIDNVISDIDITAEINEEAHEHLLLFAWTEGLFSDPEGDGNIDLREDPVNYLDVDKNGLPLGLNTLWTTGGPDEGSFRFVLKHQPEIKSPTSGINDGATDVDLIWEVVITE